MTESLMQHPAITTLSHAALRVLVVLTIGARPAGLDPRKDPGNNGAQAITESYAKKFGLSGRDTLFRSLKELEDRGLIVKTRQGLKIRKHFNLYAVAWLPITNRDGQPLAYPEKAPFGYLKWQPPLKTKKRMPEPLRTEIEIQSDHRTQFSPTIGLDQSSYSPIDTKNSPNCSPTIGNTLRISEGVPETLPTDRSNGHSEASPMRAVRKAKKIIANRTESARRRDVH